MLSDVQKWELANLSDGGWRTRDARNKTFLALEKQGLVERNPLDGSAAPHWYIGWRITPAGRAALEEGKEP